MRVFVTIVAFSISLVPLRAQAPAAAMPSAAGRAGASANPIAISMKTAWNAAAREFRESAEQMPEENYGFKPTDSVRTFGQILAHIAGTNYVICSAARGEAKTPYEEDHFEKTATTRAAILKATTDSIAYCNEAFNTATDASLAQMVRNPFGKGEQTRTTVLLEAIWHTYEHYGNLITYFRLKGMVPPSSRRRG